MKKFNLTKSACYISVLGSFMAPPFASAIQLEEVVVTAQKREQSLQDVPVAVTAFGASEITKAGITSTQDFIDLTPNVTLDDSFTYANTFVNIRGVSQINNADSPVAIVVDGVPQNNQKQLKMKLFDIERIEVLKGPQGSLYGRNAIGGAINIVTKQPAEDTEGFAKLSLGDGGLVDVSAGIGGALSDKVAYRIVGSYLEKDGLIDNAFLGTEADFVEEDYSVRGRLLFTPNDNVSIDLRLSKSEFDAGSSYDVITNNVLAPGFRSGTANNFFAPNENFLGRTVGEVEEFTLKADWDLGFATLTSITARTNLQETYRADLDFANPVDNPTGFAGLGLELGQGQDLDVELFSQELRLTSPNDQSLRWIAGVYYIETERALHTRAFVDLASLLGLDAEQQAAQIDNGIVLVDLNEDNDNTAWSVFGQVEYDLSDRLTAQLGLRYDRDDRDQLDINSGAERSEEFDAWQPKLSLNYEVSENTLGYATYSTGFRSGGFNAPTVSVTQFEDEYLQNFELGLKSRLLDGRLVFNSALFHSKSDDYQFFFVDAAAATQIIANLEEVDITGFDVDFRYLATDQLEIFGGLGYTDTDINELGSISSLIAASGVDVSEIPGNHAPKNTPFSFNLGMQYLHTLNDKMNLFTRVDYERRGKKYWQIDNLDVQESLDLLGLRIGVQSDNWSVTLWGKNLTDEEYYTDFNPAEFLGAPIDIGFPAQPRSYGIDISYNF